MMQYILESYSIASGVGGGLAGSVWLRIHSDIR